MNFGNTNLNMLLHYHIEEICEHRFTIVLYCDRLERSHQFFDMTCTIPAFYIYRKYIFKYFIKAALEFSRITVVNVNETIAHSAGAH